VAKRYKLFLILIAAFYIWFVYAATHPLLPSPHSPVVFYSNQSRCDFKHTLLQAFKKASSIHIAMYSLTDHKVIDLLRKKACSGALVNIEYDPSATPAIFDPPMSAKPLRGKGLMHRKIVVLDNSTIFIGSANLTTSSLSLHSNLSLGIYHPGLASFLINPDTADFDFTVGSQNGSLWLLPEGGRGALNRLMKAIDSAQRSICLAMFTLTHPDLVDRLIAAHQRGVKTAVALDFYSGRGSSKKAAAKLASAGVKIYLSQGSELLHHKWVWIDNKTVILGSTNWTKAAFTKNRDLLLFLSDLSPSQSRYLRNLWSALVDESKEM